MNAGVSAIAVASLVALPRSAPGVAPTPAHGRVSPPPLVPGAECRGHGVVSVVLSRGSGRLGDARDCETGADPMALAAADLDGDAVHPRVAKVDLAVSRGDAG